MLPNRDRITSATREASLPVLLSLADRTVPRADRSSLKLVDLGCHDGMLTRRMAEHLRVPLTNVTGLDINDKMVNACRRSFEAHQVDFEHDRLPCEDQTVDIVICNQVFEHVKHIYWLLAEIHRVLRPGGTLIAGVPNLASFHNRLLLLSGRQPTSVNVRSEHVRGFTARGFRQFIESNDLFAVLDGSGSGIYPLMPRWAQPISRLLPSLAVYSFYAAVRNDGDPELLLQEIAALP